MPVATRGTNSRTIREIKAKQRKEQHKKTMIVRKMEPMNPRQLQGMTATYE